MSELQHYYAGMQWLNDNKPFFYNLARSIGKPIINTNAPTAQVSFRDGEILFEYNPGFFETLTAGEIAAVIAHETYHIILKHLTEMKDGYYTNSRALLIAHEIIINDTLVASMYEVPEFVMFGHDYINDNASTYSTREAYDILKDIPDDSSSGNGSETQESNGSSGTSAESTNSVQNAADGSQSESEGSSGTLNPEEIAKLPHSHEQLSDVDDPEAFLKAIQEALEESKTTAPKISPEEVQEMPDEVKEALGIEEFEDDGITQKTGVNASSESGADKMLSSSASFTTDWVEVLKIINPKFGTKSKTPTLKSTRDWTRQQRRLAHMYPKVLSPARKVTNLDGADEGKKPVVLLALDFSASIPRSMARILAELGQSIPLDMFDVHAVTFSTKTVDFDVTSTRNKTASGGTEFSCIENKALSIKKQTGEYPYVLVFTDGEAIFSYKRPTDTQLDTHWFWFALSPKNKQFMKNNPYGDSWRMRTGSKIFRNVLGIPHKESKSSNWG